YSEHGGPSGDVGGVDGERTRAARGRRERRVLRTRATEDAAMRRFAAAGTRWTLPDDPLTPAAGVTIPNGGRARPGRSRARRLARAARRSGGTCPRSRAGTGSCRAAPARTR